MAGVSNAFKSYSHKQSNNYKNETYRVVSPVDTILETITNLEAIDDNKTQEEGEKTVSEPC